MIYNLGSINIDHLYRLPRLPLPGETVTALEHHIGLGGKGANQSVSAARAGAQVRHIGAISANGDDWVLDRLVEYGVDITDVARLPYVPSGQAVIMLDDSAENRILINGGANRRIEQDRLVQALANIGPSDTLLLQNETILQAEAAKIAHEAGARVIYSAAPFDVSAVQAVLPYVSILALNAIEAAQLAEALGDDVSVPAMLVTRGAEGAEYRDLTTGEVTHQPAFAVTPVDTTGAGDCFCGFFAAALDRGEDIANALHDAAGAASLKVTRRGAGDAIPEMAELRDFLAERGA